ncbi:variant erythrocyte surface antigen-1 family protein [Babesia divergens]|uniref:Variant erythrocyte surface antigen-1 family protein n=1 Tax=Babesia divergens TaxID=32595 RepID=A0AAD9LIA3_BABDI|nr:variant erythrocyte surface antigen-1 family protein [Babesia divergens]
MSLHTSLLVCPKNLKECIDWVLRATERDKTGTNNNIDNLKKALEAELPDFINNSIDLTQLVHGLCLFLGYPSCLCSLKANVDKSLQDISRKLIQDSEAVKSCVSKTLTLNCSNCESKNILCKCCVISCIKELREKCPCLSNPSQSCQCKDPKGKCCKDFLSGLEACLSLLNLKTDLEDCKCKPEDNCCKTGTCTSGCNVCDPQKFPDNAMTGLGICPMNPRKLAEKLEKFFGDRSSKGSSVCFCQCGTPGSSQNKSCCCLACPDTAKCSSKKSCFCGSTSQCSCASKLQLPKDSPCKTFCSKIKDVKVLVRSKEMTCCNQGKDCHCKLDSNCSTSGQNCCVEKDTYGSDVQHSVKCMLRRVVKFFASFDPSKPDCPKLCCEIFCVLKCCVFLRDFYNRGNKEKCGTCKPGGSNCNGSTLKSGKGGPCCNGTAGCKSPDCCLGCQECDAIKFRKALEELQYSSPCGQDLYRVLDDFLYFCRSVFRPFIEKKDVKEKINAAKGKCLQCNLASTSKQPCQCSAFPCPGCKALRGHNDIMAMLRHGYVPSYVNSKWEDLCQKLSSQCCVDPKTKSKNPSCSKCPCPSPGFPLPIPTSGSSGSSQSCHGQCCENCDVRKAAKIFLGMLPCLYYGLKILYDRCKYGSDFPDWSLQNISQGSIGKFLTAWGYDVHPLKSKNASDLPPILGILYGSDKIFENLYNLVSLNYFSRSISPNSSPPTTVRQMLLWLYGLRFQKHFSELVENCKSLCSPFGNSFNADAFCYYIHTSSFLAPVAIISAIETSESAQKVFTSAEWKTFSYPSDPSELFETFCEYARKIFVALTFLYFQCKRVPGQGGWQYCWYGKDCKVDSLPSGSVSSSSSPSGCSCQGSKTYLCTKDHSGKCSAASSSGSSCNAQCSHPLLRFLLDGSSDSDSQSQSPSSPFRLPSSFARLDFSQSPPAILPSSDNFLTMGFSQGNLSSTGKKGLDLGHVLHVFCDDGFYPLTRLVQFILCVSLQPPSTLLELLTFFREFISSSVFKDHFASYVDGEPGTFNGEYLKIALKRLFNHSSKSHPYDLKSLYDCSSTKGFTCGKYLFPLYNVDGVFSENFLGLYLSFVCHLAPKLKALLEKFQGEFSACCSDSSSKCKKIVECPCALPFLYSWGFSFYAPKNLNCVTPSGTSRHKDENKTGGDHDKGDSNCTQKSCADFVSQLEKVVKENSPLLKLLSEIERFIWSIRLPFVYTFLYIWILVISYFYYVQFYKLDLLHIDSHLHLPRSFKILPSTLFSDASSRLKDLSYFTL